MKTKRLDLLGFLIIILIVVVLANISYDTTTSSKIKTYSQTYLKAENLSISADAPMTQVENVRGVDTILDEDLLNIEKPKNENQESQNEVQEVEETVIETQTNPEEVKDTWIWPTNSGSCISSYYGARWGSTHNGVDISCTGFGSPIYASSSGIVTKVVTNCANSGSYGCGGTYGNSVYIKSDIGYTVLYGHMKSDILVSVGDRISQGQVIGYMGNSGTSTGTHLHFEIRDSSGTRYNPCSITGMC